MNSAYKQLKMLTVLQAVKDIDTCKPANRAFCTWRHPPRFTEKVFEKRNALRVLFSESCSLEGTAGLCATEQVWGPATCHPRSFSWDSDGNL